MSSSTYFAQECPTCGRRLHIRVEYLGKGVVCQHCRGQFVACDPATNLYGPGESALIRRAEELLRDAAGNKGRSRAARPR